MSTPPILLPTGDGSLQRHHVGPAGDFSIPDQPPTSRIAYAAAHVVADARADADPLGPARVDWDTTLAFRHHLWRHGLGVAEAMDTAQRGMGLDWPAVRELVTRSGREAAAVGGLIASGVNTDQLDGRAGVGLADITGAYEEQLEVVEGAGGRAVLMASRHLAASATSADDYLTVYGNLLDQVREPAIIHWLGDMFDPALAGYWGTGDLDAATDTVLQLCADNAAHVDGLKMSLLDADREIAVRSRLPDDVRLYTGDDFNFPDLIAGDDTGHSDALLGIFDPIAPAAAAALAALDAGQPNVFHQLLEPTVALSREVFAAPTSHYKTGVVFLAWLNDHQDHFRMVGGLESARSVVHLARVFRCADAAGLLADPDLARHRFCRLLEVAGIGQV